jgi:uncharacterized protein YbjT (DUF2867 family)
LDSGRRVRTITGLPKRANGFGARIEFAPVNFTDWEALVRSLKGAAVLYDTYWVRFHPGRATFDEAVTNSSMLIQAAKEAGVGRIVHLSIANPSLESHLPDDAGKALVEKAIVDSGLPYAILRPTVIFGIEDILIHNIAWFVRHLPVFAIPGTGAYELQPIFAEDLAELATHSAQNEENLVLDAVGPEIFSFEDLVRKIAAAVGADPKFIHASPRIAFQMLRLAGPVVGDVVLTREEIEGLMANPLVSTQPPTGQARFTAWLSQNNCILGKQYASELQRRYGWELPSTYFTTIARIGRVE